MRRKFGLLALIYVTSIAANLLLAGYCISIYFQSAFVETELDSALERQVERLWVLVRAQRILLEQPENPASRPAELQAVRDELAETVSQMNPVMAAGPIPELWSSVAQKISRTMNAPAPSAGPEPSPGAGGGASSRDSLRALLDLEALLVHVNTALHQHERNNVAKAADVRRAAFRILLADGVFGGLLCILVFLLVRRWVIRPIADLRAATQQLAAGNFACRVKPRSGDELGRLSAEVSLMSSMMVETQARVVEREKLVAAGEIAAHLSRNIRAQLEHIRAVTAALGQTGQATSERAEFQQRICDTIARFEEWLDDLQQSVSPLTLNPGPVAVDTVLSRLLAAMRPLLDQRNMRAEISLQPDMGTVNIDAARFEQALVALLTNAIQASRDGQTVRIDVRTRTRASGEWEVTVEDHGAGIPRELQEKIFLPNFTTRRGGNGIGLSIANKVVRLHGGELLVDSEPGKGSRFTAILPGMSSDSSPALHTATLGK